MEREIRKHDIIREDDFNATLFPKNKNLWELTEEDKSYAVASTAFNPTPNPSPRAGRGGTGAGREKKPFWGQTRRLTLPSPRAGRGWGWGENPFFCAQLRNS